MLLSARPPILKLPSEGVVGVGGNEPDDSVGEARLEARLRGRKMPEPATEVVKYRTLGKRLSEQDVNHMWLYLTTTGH